MMNRTRILVPIVATAAVSLLVVLLTIGPVSAYIPSPLFGTSRRAPYTCTLPFHSSTPTRLAVSTEESSGSGSNAVPSSSLPPPILNGKLVLPVPILTTGLKGHEDTKISCVYALLGRQFKRGSGEGWDSVIHVGVSQDFATSIKAILAANDEQQGVAHVRALSFSFPDPVAMQTVADQWKNMAVKAGAEFQNVVDPSLFLFDDDDDDDDEDDDWDVEMTAQSMASVMPSPPSPTPVSSDDDKEAVVSPFATASDSDDNDDENDVEALSMPKIQATTSSSGLDFTRDTVDVVLNEIRPYLISDGGNATVESVDESTKTVYLKLLGACGTCPSSTVTMQMGIERVLKENFGNDVSVTQVEDGSPGEEPTELTFEAVEQEVQRLSAAVIAMGGVVRILDVHSSTGVVELEFRGANKVQKGLELALLDLPFCNAVQFVSGDDF